MKPVSKKPEVTFIGETDFIIHDMFQTKELTNYNV